MLADAAADEKSAKLVIEMKARCEREHALKKTEIEKLTRTLLEHQRQRNACHLSNAQQLMENSSRQQQQYLGCTKRFGLVTSPFRYENKKSYRDRPISVVGPGCRIDQQNGPLHWLPSRYNTPKKPILNISPIRARGLHRKRRDEIRNSGPALSPKRQNLANQLRGFFAK
jgi:hypothetical protein